MNSSLLSLSLGTTLTFVSSSQSESLQRSLCVVLKTSIEHLAVLPLPSRSMDNSCGAPHTSASPLWHSSSSFSASLSHCCKLPHIMITLFFCLFQTRRHFKTYQQPLSLQPDSSHVFSFLDMAMFLFLNFFIVDTITNVPPVLPLCPTCPAFTTVVCGSWAMHMCIYVLFMAVFLNAGMNRKKSGNL